MLLHKRQNAYAYSAAYAAYFAYSNLCLFLSCIFFLFYYSQFVLSWHLSAIIFYRLIPWEIIFKSGGWWREVIGRGNYKE